MYACAFLLVILYTRFFISKTYKQRQAEIGKKLSKCSEAELSLFENYSDFSSTLSSKSNRIYSKNKQNNTCVSIHNIIRLIIMRMKTKKKSKSHRRDISRPRSRRGHKYSLCVNIVQCVCVCVRASVCVCVCV